MHRVFGKKAFIPLKITPDEESAAGGALNYELGGPMSGDVPGAEIMPGQD